MPEDKNRFSFLSGKTAVTSYLVLAFIWLYLLNSTLEEPFGLDFDSLNELGTSGGFVFAGTMTGVIYFFVSELGMSKNNRSYLANPLTDILAFIGSSFLVIRGLQIEELIIVFVGSAIFTIHLLQLIFKNGFE